MSLGLSHSLSRYKLKFSPDKVASSLSRVPQVRTLSHAHPPQCDTSGDVHCLAPWYSGARVLYIPG